jgi:hypothetical protein
MFCHSVVPKLRSYYLKDPTNARQVKAYKQKCRKFAAKLQLPQWQWPLVTLPFFISMDWDPRHSWVRQVLACPRAQDDEIGAVLRDAREANFTLAPALDPAQMESDNVRDADNRGGLQPMLSRARKNLQTLDQQREQYRKRHKHDCELMALFNKAIAEPSMWATLIFQQFMPLSKVSPDMHCTPELAAVEGADKPDYAAECDPAEVEWCNWLVPDQEECAEAASAKFWQLSRVRK